MGSSAIVILEDGSLFRGTSIGIDGTSVGEIVFNTAMMGYQEILTDPSYASQIVNLTTAHVGNTGTNSEDCESGHVWAAGLIIRNLPKYLNNWRSQQSLHTFLQENNVVAISNVDTRAITRLIREKGEMRACITTEYDEYEALSRARTFPGLEGKDLASIVSTEKVYTWTEGTWNGRGGFKDYPESELPYHVVAYDFGIKRAILRYLVDFGCHVTVVPAKTSAEFVMSLQPDGVFLSNGPGDPAACVYAIKAIESLLEEQVPLFGICLGHQLLSIAAGAKTKKMKFGHHGANHPIQSTDGGKVMVSSQNHSFAVDEATLPKDLLVSHRSLFDRSIEGVVHTRCPAFGFQAHPEANPGPQDCKELFQQFLKMMVDKKSVINEVRETETTAAVS